MKRTLFFSALLGLLSLAGHAEEKTVKVEGKLKAEGILIVVDRSGSMDSVFAQIKTNMKDLVGRIPKDEPSGLIHFAGCEDKDVVHSPSFGLGNHDKILATMGRLEAAGSTALAKAMEMAYGVMKNTGTCAQLVLFTDGYETCGGNPLIWAKKASEMCAELNVNVITSSSDEKTLELYNKMLQAMKSKGKIYQVDSISDGTKAVTDILQEGKKSQRAFGQLKQGKTQESGSTSKTEDEAAKNDPKKKDPAKAGQSQGQTQKKGGGDK